MGFEMEKWEFGFGGGGRRPKTKWTGGRNKS
jgi:hypothetical protein